MGGGNAADWLRIITDDFFGTAAGGGRDGVVGSTGGSSGGGGSDVSGAALTVETRADVAFSRVNGGGMLGAGCGGTGGGGAAMGTGADAVRLGDTIGGASGSAWRPARP